MGELNLIRELLGRGVNIEAQNSKGYTPLMKAKSVDVLAKVLVDHGANVNNPLHCAIRRNKFDLVQFFYRSGADLNTDNGDGFHLETAAT